MVAPRVRPDNRVSPATGVGEREVGYKIYLEILEPVLSTWRGYFASFDPDIGPDPGMARTGALIDTWTNQRNSAHVCPAPAAGQRPSKVENTGYFGGRPVVRLATTGSTCLSNSVAGAWSPAILQTGERPYYLIVTRNVVATVGEDRILDASDTFTFRHNALQYFETDLSVRANLGGAEVTLGAGSLDQRPHVYEVWIDASTGCWLRRDFRTTANNAGGTAALAGNVTAFSIGCFRNTATHFGDNDVFEIHAFSAKPSEAICGKLVAAAARKASIIL